MSEFMVYLDELRLRSLLPGSHRCVFAAGSRVRGWGNATSDVDLYVIGDEPWSSATEIRYPIALRPDTVPTQTFHVDGMRVEVRYWLDTQVDQLLAKVSQEAFENYRSAEGRLGILEHLLLDRIPHAVALDGPDWLERRRAQLAGSAFRTVIAARYLSESDGFVEDTAGQLESGDIVSAVLSARLAFSSAIGALLAVHGECTPAVKWRARLMRSTTQDVVPFAEYWHLETMRGYDPADPTGWILACLAVCRRVSMEVEFS